MVDLAGLPVTGTEQMPSFEEGSVLVFPKCPVLLPLG